MVSGLRRKVTTAKMRVLRTQHVSRTYLRSRQYLLGFARDAVGVAAKIASWLTDCSTLVRAIDAETRTA